MITYHECVCWKAIRIKVLLLICVIPIQGGYLLVWRCDMERPMCYIRAVLSLFLLFSFFLSLFFTCGVYNFHHFLPCLQERGIWLRALHWWLDPKGVLLAWSIFPNWFPLQKKTFRKVRQLHNLKMVPFLFMLVVWFRKFHESERMKLFILALQSNLVDYESWI